MLGYIRQAAQLIDAGQGDNRVVVARRVVKAPKPPVEVPAEFTAALRTGPQGGCGVCGVQPELPAGVCGVDYRGKAAGDAAEADCPGGGVDRGREAAELEVSGVLTARFNFARRHNDKR